MQQKAIRRIDRHGRRLRVGASAWVLVAGLLGAGPAAGVPTDCTIAIECVTFSGLNGFGFTENDATDASAILGIPILQAAELFPAAGILSESIVFNPAADLDPFFPSAEGPNIATQEWTIRNITGSSGAEPARDLIGNAYFLFVALDGSFEDASLNDIDYGAIDLGLILPNRNLDPGADPWVIIEASVGNETFFYPAVDLASLPIGFEADAFDVRLFIGGPLQEPLNSIFVLPRFQVGAGFTAIPEPGTALMLGLGLAGLAVTGRPRS